MKKPEVTSLEEGYIVFGHHTKEEAYQAIKDYEQKELGLGEDEGVGIDWLYWCEKISSRKVKWQDEDGKWHWSGGETIYNMSKENKRGRPGWYALV